MINENALSLHPPAAIASVYSPYVSASSSRCYLANEGSSRFPVNTNILPYMLLFPFFFRPKEPLVLSSNYRSAPRRSRSLKHRERRSVVQELGRGWYDLLFRATRAPLRLWAFLSPFKGALKAV